MYKVYMQLKFFFKSLISCRKIFNEKVVLIWTLQNVDTVGSVLKFKILKKKTYFKGLGHLGDQETMPQFMIFLRIKNTT